MKATVAEAIRGLGVKYPKPQSVDGMVAILKQIFNKDSGPLMPLRLETSRSKLFRVIEHCLPMFIAGCNELRFSSLPIIQEPRWGSTTQRGLEGMAEIFEYDLAKKLLANNANPHRDRQVAEVVFIKRSLSK